jgi:ribosomal protein S18 acetylase RimI-like enzyme
MTVAAIENLESNETATEARAMAALTVAFANDPAVRWLYPDARQYLRHFPDFAWAFAGKAFEFGTADKLEGHSTAALWLPPNVQPDETAIGDVVHESVDEFRRLEVFSLLEQMGAFHPSEPHWYLPMIGVDPTEQGRGYGSALLRRGLARCDATGLPAYLESTNPRNVPLYERFGFKVVGQVKTRTSPVIIPMVRPAQ